MNTILDILKLRGIEAKRKQGASCEEYASACPKCGGKDRFTYWLESDTFYCRGCEASGNMVKFFMQIDGMSEQEALIQFFICKGKSADDAEKAARNAIKRQRGEVRQSAPIRPRKVEAKPVKPVAAVDVSAWRHKVGALVEWAHDKLLQNQSVLSWLRSERGITLDTVKRCKLGWNPSALFRDRQDFGLSDELNSNGRPKKVWIPAGLVIPGYNSAGDLTRVKIRQPDEQRQGDTWKRYVELSGSQREFVYYGEIRRAFIVVESELDAILIEQEAGRVITAVSTGSASNRANNDADIKTLSSAGRVLVSLDNDEAGAKSAVRSWLRQFKNARLWLIPGEYGKDHTEAQKNGLPLLNFVEIGLDLPEIITAAVRLARVSSEADQVEIDRSLHTIDICRAGADYDFALAVLAAKVEDILYCQSAADQAAA